jgi:hypothetical protein
MTCDAMASACLTQFFLQLNLAVWTQSSSGDSEVVISIDPLAVSICAKSFIVSQSVAGVFVQLICYVGRIKEFSRILADRIKPWISFSIRLNFSNDVIERSFKSVVTDSRARIVIRVSPRRKRRISTNQFH